jgi:hypothetical protein
VAVPDFESTGDLPEGLHRATFDDVLTRFGVGTSQRQGVAARLLRVHQAARTTGKLERFVIFGSFITSKPEPNDIDIVLVMRDDFNLNDYDAEVRALFHHLEAQKEFGASVFWIRPSLLILETLDEFLAHWQIKRDGTSRGIIEVIT